MLTDNAYDKRIYDEMMCIMWGLLCDSVSFLERNSNLHHSVLYLYIAEGNKRRTSRGPYEKRPEFVSSHPFKCITAIQL